MRRSFSQPSGPPSTSSRPRNRLAATLRFSARFSSWWISTMPRRRASRDAVQVDRLAVERDFAGVGPVDAGEDLHQRGFAGPVLADQGQHLAGADGQRHAVEGLNAGEVLADVADFEERRCGHGVTRRDGRAGGVSPPVGAAYRRADARRSPEESLLAQQLVQLVAELLDGDALLLAVDGLGVLLAAVLGDDAEVDGNDAVGRDASTCRRGPAPPSSSPTGSRTGRGSARRCRRCRRRRCLAASRRSRRSRRS